MGCGCTRALDGLVTSEEFVVFVVAAVTGRIDMSVGAATFALGMPDVGLVVGRRARDLVCTNPFV